MLDPEHVPVGFRSARKALVVFGPHPGHGAGADTICVTASAAKGDLTAQNIGHRNIDRVAAEQVAAQHAWGACRLVGTSSATTFAAGPAFLRVVEQFNDPTGTLSVAAFAAESLGGPHPLTLEPFHVIIDGHERWVETYELVTFDRDRLLPSLRELGHHLALLHAVDVSGSGLRQQRRLAVARSRLAFAPKKVRTVLDPLFDVAESALEGSAGPMVLCHGDTNGSNLVPVLGRGWVWVDFEYAGLAPASFDVGVAIADTLRFFGRGGAREFVNGYRAAGGDFDASDAVVLAGVRELVGVADFASKTIDAGVAKFVHRMASRNELFRQTTWSVAN